MTKSVTTSTMVFTNLSFHFTLNVLLNNQLCLIIRREISPCDLVFSQSASDLHSKDSIGLLILANIVVDYKT